MLLESSLWRLRGLPYAARCDGSSGRFIVMPTLFEETKFSVFAGSKDLPSLLNRLERVFLDGKQQIQVAVVASKRPILQVLREMEARTPERITLKEQAENSSNAIAAFSLKRRYGLKEKKSVHGDFLVVPEVRGNMSLLICLEPLAFWHEGLSPFLDWAYPRFVTPFFTQVELHQFIRNIHKALPTHRVRIRRTSSRERLRSGDARKKYKSQVEWTDIDADTLFREAAARNTLFRYISFELVFPKEDGKLVSDDTFGSISKYGYLSCTSRFDLFYGTVIQPMMEYGETRLKFLQGRTRDERTNFIPKPVKIEYDSEVFANVRQIGKLLETLRRFKHGSCSVLHGNPYLHVSMLDNYDYSAADVWVLNRNEVLIVPQIRTSEAALKRIIGHIFENFREGRLAEARA